MENQQTDVDNAQTTIAWLGIERDIDHIQDPSVRLKVKNRRLEIRVIKKKRDGKDNIILEIIPCVYLGEGVEHGEYGDPIVTMGCSDFGIGVDRIIDIVWGEHGKDVSGLYKQHMFGSLYSAIADWLGNDGVTDTKEIRYLLQCKYEEGRQFDADTVNRLYLNKTDAMDDLAATAEEVEIEFVSKYGRENVETEWWPDRTRCEINAYDCNGEVADTWVGRIEAMETLTGFKA